MTSYVRKQQFDAVQFEKEWIILNSEAYTVTKLNEIGGLYWLLLSEAQSAASLAHLMQNEYGYEQDEQDIKLFLDDLMKYGLVQYAG
ncbi:PqqD family protein [Ectobacillus polymachus]|uniref:PqqD family protein n=1 Tax=Ectobacillus polymachus TaxID=1508806 RepID=UPI003A8871C4